MKFYVLYKMYTHISYIQSALIYDEGKVDEDKLTIENDVHYLHSIV